MAKTSKKNDKEVSEERRILTPTGRGSYMHLFEPSTYKGKTTYSVTFLFDKKKTDMSKIIAARDAAMEDEFDGEIPEDYHDSIVDGDAKKYADKEGYKGHWVVKAWSGEEFQPSIVDQIGEDILSARDLVSGDYVRGKVFAFGWGDLQKGGWSFLLDGVQLMKKGEPFGKGKAKFDPVSTEEDEEIEADESDSEEISEYNFA